MANAAISSLTASATNLTAADILPVVQTTGVGPVKMTGQQLARGLLGSTTLSGTTITADAPVLNLTQTWNNAAVTFTGVRLNITDTASNAASLLMDLQVGGVSKAQITKQGGLRASDGQLSLGNGFRFVGSTNGFYTANASAPNFYAAISNNAVAEFISSGIGLGSNSLSWGNIGSTQDIFLTRRGAANLRLGAADAAAPVAQTLSVQSVVAGTSNTAGANLTITGSQGTGTGAGGSIIFQVAPAGSSGTAQNALATALEITSTRRLMVQPQGGLGGSVAASYGFIGASSNTGFDFDTILGSAYACRGGAVSAIFLQNNQVGIGGSDTILARDAANTLALRNGTNAQELRVYKTTTGTVYKALRGDNNLIKISGEAFADGAGANAGTLANSPVTGNPTKWIPIDDNGTTRYIPAW